MDKAARLSGARFAYRMGDAALVELALYRFALDRVVDRGFTPVLPPVIVREEAMFATGFLPTEEANLYRVEPDGLYLTGTSEVALAGLHADEILDADALPLRYAGYSTCFRRESGAAGHDTRGIFRVHQFDKVEMYVFCAPKASSDEHESLLAIEEEIVRRARYRLPGRQHCGGRPRTVGVKEVRHRGVDALPGPLPGDHVVLEHDRLPGAPVEYPLRDNEERRIVHTLNGTAMTARALIAVMETYQERDGTVEVPPALLPFGAPERISATGS